ncbi:helix-turn-helix transcriptional regulator [Streptomyces fulvissimus]|uniref:Helix-turn-helix transcriptional regulator n=1 Tax=Streptomyces microflavus TaxID=1919 RepID=A0A6N9VMF3_STRMI|nr:helix-turn-helix transcriptional regulator [Streptomyces microflavus]NEB70354.1 helix-turn-helix transcriptional regulator [Streptomyces microflavus]NEB72418.1 helix-turn-helix transcriptional regulator [Streptomyces microflavus]NEE52058.1 helix-turn-helix transcriptional regulator [Streptomyces sp. SID8455]
MPPTKPGPVGHRIAYYRRLARLTQQQLADAAFVSLGAIRKIERGERGVSDDTLDNIAAALGIDPSRLVADREHVSTRIRDALPTLSAAIATYDLPDDGPVRPLSELRTAVAQTTAWRLSAQYLQIARTIPDLLGELARAAATAPPGDSQEVARLLVTAYRSADAVAYKYGARDLSARLIDLMRWAAPGAQDPLLAATVGYVRTETFFAAHAHTAGLRALEQALDVCPAPTCPQTIAARGALHMRAAVIAGRAGRGDAADEHLDEARVLGDRVREGVYQGTAFGPDSVRIHEVSVAVSLGDDHVGRAFDVAREWAPPVDMPAERRSGFYVELARAQLWGGMADDAFESLKVARRIAPQHTREHPWVREDAATLRRLKRADAESLTNFAEWCHAD